MVSIPLLSHRPPVSFLYHVFHLTLNKGKAVGKGLVVYGCPMYCLLCIPFCAYPISISLSYLFFISREMVISTLTLFVVPRVHDHRYLHTGINVHVYSCSQS